MIQISKLDAARRQAEVAIRLYFAEGDPVSIHTLTGAAYTLIADLSESAGHTRTLRAQLSEALTPEGEALFRAKLAEAQNFFKHANRDGGSVLSFDARQTELILLDACLEYCRLAGESPPLLRLFVTWCALRMPDLFPAASTLVAPFQYLADLPRSAFFAEYLPLAETVAAGEAREPGS
jgi:hypothetical protein